MKTPSQLTTPDTSPIHADHSPTDESSRADGNPRSRPAPSIQLELEGIGTLHPLIASGHVDPRFILSDETCRIGRKHLAEIRRLLMSTVERPAA